jgi:hypothetical protein
MAQPRLKDLVYEPESTAEARATFPAPKHESALPPFNDYGAVNPEDERKEAIRTLVRLIAWSATGAFAVLAAAAMTGHLLAGLLVLGGLTGVTALLMIWGNWILDNTVSW